MAANFPGGVVINERNAGVAIPIRRVVRAATLIPGTLATGYENGDSVDGVVLVTGDRILIKNQASAVENGIYVVEAAGAPFRDVDFEDGASVAGMIIPVVDGSQAGTIWHCTNILGSDIVGVDSLTFELASGTIKGPGASTDNAVVRWDGVTGTLIKNSSAILSDAGNLTGLADVGMSGNIIDANGNELINFTMVAAAVNEIAITNATVGTNPVISATGDDVTISIEYIAKGSGVHIFDNDTIAAEVRLRDTAGTDYFGIRPAAATTSYTITMPSAQGAVNTSLQNDGSGNLSWVVNGNGDVVGPGASTDNAVVRWDGITGKLIKNSSAILSDTGNLTNLANVGMSGDILDANGNELINFTTVAAAVNEIAITNAAIGTNPIISATGGDINISLEYLSKGTGVHIFDNPSTAAEIRLRDDAGTDYFGIRPAAVTTSYTVTMPAAQGGVSTYLQNNGVGILSWVAGTSGVIQSYFTSTNGTTSTSNTTYTLIGSMTISTPAAGTYAVWFSSSIEKNNNTGFGNYMISIDGGVSISSNSERTYEPSAGADFHSASTQAMVTVTGAENIQAYFKIGSGGGSITMSDRSIMAIKLS